MKRFVRTAAQDDIRRQFRYYLVHEDAPEVAWKFLDAAEEAIQFVVRNPQLGSPRFFPNKTLKGLRAWPIAGFEDIWIYYVLTPEVVRIVRVLHGKRDLARILRREDASID